MPIGACFIFLLTLHLTIVKAHWVDVHSLVGANKQKNGLLLRDVGLLFRLDHRFGLFRMTFGGFVFLRNFSHRPAGKRPGLLQLKPNKLVDFREYGLWIISPGQMLAPGSITREAWSRPESVDSRYYKYKAGARIRLENENKSLGLVWAWHSKPTARSTSS